ncbi:hypothetical protein M408DRAFT_28924 [Serendipita vermifera MAFF 305830]|uniref:Uncharacterized protein n=1 Tax=Serendipita vermifera MAFF 305830 TaxID=933852 RepID=A0A0C3ASG1_SERVB|nr:hypothetical protein M408DRAFT_28924 [Serendipita vermifera MAFF 305830]
MAPAAGHYYQAATVILARRCTTSITKGRGCTRICMQFKRNNDMYKAFATKAASLVNNYESRHTTKYYNVGVLKCLSQNRQLQTLTPIHIEELSKLYVALRIMFPIGQKMELRKLRELNFDSWKRIKHGLKAIPQMTCAPCRVLDQNLDMLV